MIPRNFSEVGWPDLDRLVDLQREEDDTIEFKSGFKGGDDYVALNEKGREQALDAIAREVLAFLNTRGGDLVIGIKESTGTRPTASSVSTVANPHDAADRIARGLAAIIEPAQTNVAVRALMDPSDPQRGVVLIRVQASARAPHRSKRSRECYARRGSESVPMAMDEIQDTTLYRARLRLEQAELLDRQFIDFLGGKAGHRRLGPDIIHVRTVLFPYLEQSIAVDDEVLTALGNINPLFYDRSGNSTSNDVAFRGVSSAWKPVLRGKKRESYDEYTRSARTDVQFASKIIKDSGICIFDYAASAHFDDARPGIHFEWLAGYLAQVCLNIGRLSDVRPSTLPATVRLAVRAEGDMIVRHGRGGFWGGSNAVPDDIYFFPDFLVNGVSDINDFFRQAQVDFYSLMNAPLDNPFSLELPNSL